MAVRIINTRYTLHKKAGVVEDIGNWAAKFTKDNPSLTRALGHGIPAALGVGLLAKSLGSDNAALWGLLGGSAVAGGDYFLRKNPDYVPDWDWIQRWYGNPKKKRLDKLTKEVEQKFPKLFPKAPRYGKTIEELMRDYSNAGRKDTMKPAGLLGN